MAPRTSGFGRRKANSHRTSRLRKTLHSVLFLMTTCCAGPIVGGTFTRKKHRYSVPGTIRVATRRVQYGLRIVLGGSAFCALVLHFLLDFEVEFAIRSRITHCVALMSSMSVMDLPIRGLPPTTSPQYNNATTLDRSPVVLDAQGYNPSRAQRAKKFWRFLL